MNTLNLYKLNQKTQKKKTSAVSSLLTLLIVFGLTTVATSVRADAAKEVRTSVSSSSPFTVIPMIGVTSFNITGLDSDSIIPSSGNRSKTGSLLGVMGGYKLSWMDSTLETGLLIFETGSKVSVQWGFFEAAAVETTLSYLSLPVNIRIPLFTLAETLYHVKAGVMTSVLTSAKVEGTGLAATGSSSNIKGEINSLDLMASLSVGGKYDINDQFHVLGDVTYHRGLTKVVKDGGGYHQGLSVGLALGISI